MEAIVFRNWASLGFDPSVLAQRAALEPKALRSNIKPQPIWESLCQLGLTHTELSHGLPIIIISKDFNLSIDDTTGIHHRQRHMTITNDVIVNTLAKNPLSVVSDIQNLYIDPR